MIIWLNSWIFCQRCAGQKSKPYELEAVQNVACCNFSLKLKNGQNGRSVYISAVCIIDIEVRETIDMEIETNQSSWVNIDIGCA